VQSFAPALRNELKDTGVSVTALMPGPVDTEFFAHADMDQDTKVGTGDRDDPATSHETALRHWRTVTNGSFPIRFLQGPGDRQARPT
jgi:short-subunit dehydrogenase